MPHVSHASMSFHVAVDSLSAYYRVNNHPIATFPHRHKNCPHGVQNSDFGRVHKRVLIIWEMCAHNISNNCDAGTFDKWPVTDDPETRECWFNGIYMPWRKRKKPFTMESVPTCRLEWLLLQRNHNHSHDVCKMHWLFEVKVGCFVYLFEGILGTCLDHMFSLFVHKFKNARNYFQQSLDHII